MKADGAQAAPPQNAVMPFWQRMPHLFLFPLRRAPLVRILVATAVFCAAVWYAQPRLASAPLFSRLLLACAWCASTLYISQYAFIVIERSASGYLDTRSYPALEGAPEWRRPIKMFLVLVLVPWLIVFLGQMLLPGLIVLIAVLVFALLLPASVMVMTLNDSFADAANPVRCARTAWSIGPPYLLLCLYLVLLFIGSLQAIHALLPDPRAALPPAGAAASVASATGVAAQGLSVLVVTLVGNYFLILTCALIGYAMYQYSAVLGITVVGPGDLRAARRTSSAAHARRQREALIGRLVTAGEFREALELVSDDLRQRPSDLSLHARFHTLLLHEGSQPRIEDHADRYLELLLNGANTKDALALLRQTRERYPDFVPRDPARLPQLAEAALEAQQPDLAAALIRGFDKKNPGHASIPEVYVLGGRLMLQAGRATDARQLFLHVTGKYPQSTAAAQARRFLERFNASAPNRGGAGYPPGTKN